MAPPREDAAAVVVFYLSGQLSWLGGDRWLVGPYACLLLARLIGLALGHNAPSPHTPLVYRAKTPTTMKSFSQKTDSPLEETDSNPLGPP